MSYDLDFIVMAGPCSAESEAQIMRIAKGVKEAGAGYLRAGAWKPRTKGGDWEGYKAEGLKWMQKARKEFGMKTVTEILGPSDPKMSFQDAIDLFLEHEVDLFQVGARNAQNQELLNALGAARVPVLLKNGMNTTYSEWMGSATRLDQEKVMLCVRGKNNETDVARNGQDITTIAKLVNDKKYPIIFDPSHIAGRRESVYDITMGAVAMGVGGMIVEVHYDPITSRTDSRQAITPEQFRHLMKGVHMNRDAYLRQRSIKESFLSASIPQHVDIYFRPESLAIVHQALRNINEKPYFPDKATKILCARVPANAIQDLKTAKFSVGRMTYYNDERLNEGVQLDSPDGRKFHISPYSLQALEFRGSGPGALSEGRERIEYANGFPDERIRDAFLTIEMRIRSLNLDRVVLYRLFNEPK